MVTLLINKRLEMTRFINVTGALTVDVTIKRLTIGDAGVGFYTFHTCLTQVLCSKPSK